MNKSPLLYILAGPLAAHALAQPSNVSPVNKFAWSENAGWINFRDAGNPDGAQGVMVGESVLSGFAWCENLGWLNVGDGSPANGTAYANLNGSDFGVNVLPNDTLTGLAWGENVGWINFAGGALANPAKPARFDEAERRLRGFAWGENVGWINLDDSTHFVGVLCPSDFDGNGFVNGDDYDAFVLVFAEGDQAADFDGNGFVTGDDFDAFVDAFAAGC